MTFDRKRSKGDSDGGQTHLETSAHGPGIDDYGKMQQRAPIETSDGGTEAAEARPASPAIMPLTQSKMHASSAPPAPEPPLLPRRSALMIEILSLVLIAFLVGSALLFNLAPPGTLISTSSRVSVQLPPKPAEPAALPSVVSIVQDDHSAAEAAGLAPVDPVVQEDHSAEAPPATAAALPEVQPQAGSEAMPQAERPVETVALPPAAEPIVPEASTPTVIEAAPAPAPPPAGETAAVPLPSETTQALIRRGDQLLGVGDIVAARFAYERAAEDGNRVAAIGVAKTYDPIFLAQIGVRGLRGDPARAALWYRLAAAAGDREAQQRLRRLRAQYPQ